MAFLDIANRRRSFSEAVPAIGIRKAFAKAASAQSGFFIRL